jgi:hypothetical protein
MHLIPGRSLLLVGRLEPGYLKRAGRREPTHHNRNEKPTWSVMNSALSLISFALLAAASSTPILNVSQAQWRSLNSTVGGRLHTATPFAQPCFSVYNNHSVNPDEQACAVIQANYNSPEFRVDSFSANMFVSGLGPLTVLHH